MAFAIENLRLKELAIIAEHNRPMFDDFILYLRGEGYQSLHAFIVERSKLKGGTVLLRYLTRPLPAPIALYDGVARPYKPDRAKWLLLGWILRDAPVQRLRPMVASMPGNSAVQKQATLLNEIRVHVATIFPEPGRWEWNVIAEVIIDRLEGSRRAIKGTLFEAIVRRILEEIFKRRKIAVQVSDVEIKLEGETYDVSVKGERGQILIPVKTRETMGGGHALLFTRDIHKSISAAHDAGFECLPVIIAESWSGDEAYPVDSGASICSRCGAGGRPALLRGLSRLMMSQ